MNKSENVKAAATAEECLENLKLTRDFEVYLDMLNTLKGKYLIILCLKNTSEQNIIETVAEKIHGLGFSGFTAEPDRDYVGVIGNGGVIRDIASPTDQQPRSCELTVSKTKLSVSFEEKEAEIKINGKDYSLNSKGINIVVFDMKRFEAVDVSCYNAAEKNPEFYHRNFYYDEQYIDSHVFVPETYKDFVTLPMRKSYFSNRTLNVREVERGIFLPIKGFFEIDKYFHEQEMYTTYGGICDENMNFVAGHQLQNPGTTSLDSRHISDSYKVRPEEITYIDETVLYGGSLMEHPGHLITECFADRLWWILQNADSDIKIAYEVIYRTPKLIQNKISFVREFFEAFGISEDRLIAIEKPTQFKKIIIPDQCAIPSHYCFPYDFTGEYIKVFQHITKQLTPGKYKKIYLSKRKLHTQAIIGEKYFMDFFEKKGFEIIDPEDYNIREKAELMYGAEEVVTTDGTNSLFTVFCKPTVKLTILTRREVYWDAAQQLINEAVGIKDFFLVNTSGNFLDSYHEDFSDQALHNFTRGLQFTFATKEFARYVKQVYNEELDTASEDSFKKYLLDYLAYFPEYYTKSNNHVYQVRNIKMTDILRSMSEIFLGKTLDTSDLDFMTEDEINVKKLEFQFQDEKKANAEKIQQLSDKAKEFIDEITRLRQALSQRESEIAQLRKENAELSSYMAEISGLLDALESQGGIPAEE